jgi:type I restriction enzyme S subunit
MTRQKLKQSEIGMIPKDWNVLNLGSVSEIKGGKRLPKGEAFSDLKTDYPYIRISDFSNTTVDLGKLRYLKQETKQKIKNYTISSNDVYISIAGTIGLAGTVPEILDGANLTENAAKISNLKNLNKKFLAYILNSNLIQSQIKSLIGKATQPKLALFRIEQIKIPIPSLVEQEQIADILFTVDSRIDIVERERRRVERLKAGIMRALFDKKWKTVKFGDVINMKRGFSYRSNQINKEGLGKKQLITINNFNKEGGLKNNAEIIFIFDNVNIPNEFLVKKNDLFIANTDMSKGLIVGSPIIIENLKEETIYSMDLTKIQFDVDLLDPLFLFYFLRSNNIRKIMKMNAQGTNVLHLNHDLIKSIEIPIPALEEQKRIAQILSTIDIKLSIQLDKKSKLERIKKSLMDDLLTGKKRIKEFINGIN